MTDATTAATTRTDSDRVVFPPEVAVLIPAWEPPETLIDLAPEILERGCSHVIVVDDGSGAARAAMFAELAVLRGVTLLRHRRNAGKGNALKTGFRYLLAHSTSYAGVVTADADGQHAPEDIARVAQALVDSERFVLGVRGMDKDVPLRSKLGNLLTRWAFRLITQSCVSDTQTGLRGFPMHILPEVAGLPGDRYQYEITVLAHLCESKRPPLEIPISTIYLDGNRSSHFHPVRDSIRIYSALLKLTLQKLSLSHAVHEDAAY